MTYQERHNPSTGSGLGRRVDLDHKIKQNHGTIVKKRGSSAFEGPSRARHRKGLLTTGGSKDSRNLWES